VRTLTLEDRRIIEKMWANNLKPVQIAAALGIIQCAVYTELKRGQELNEQTGEEILDMNFRSAYHTEWGEAVYQRNLRNRGRRPKRQNAGRVAGVPYGDRQSVGGHRAFCDSCIDSNGTENCDTPGCPHEAERNNPMWWLKQGEEPDEAMGLTIKVKAAFPIEWGREYYTVAEKKKEQRAACTCCDNTGKVTVKGVEYVCPRCKGDWREKEVVGETTIYFVAK